MKEITISLRVSKDERAKIGKAARDHKNLSAFLLSAARHAIIYRRLIEQAQKLGLKTTAMKVVEG